MRIKVLLLCAITLLIGCGSGPQSRQFVDSPPQSFSNDDPLGFIQERWEGNMRLYGKMHCDPQKIKELSTWEGNVWYYDGVRVYFQIADYTKDPSWKECARYVRDLYRNYVLSSQGKIPGWRVFPHGLTQDALRNGDPLSKQAVLLLAQNSAFAPQGGGESYELSRETAYLINTHLATEELGMKRNPLLSREVDFALGHLNQWTGTQTAPYVKPFMMALTAEALITYHEHTNDSRVLPALKHAFDWLWETAWNNTTQSFPYIICKPGTQHQECLKPPDEESADLNLLIVPVYGWLYMMTGDDKYREEGDRIFASGVDKAFLKVGKQFSQNYRWSFDYITWRNEAGG